jgi:tRNA (cmo5U34)-methyltransferase
MEVRRAKSEGRSPRPSGWLPARILGTWGSFISDLRIISSSCTATCLHSRSSKTGLPPRRRSGLMSNPEARLVGIDVSAEMLKEARRVLPADRVERLIVSAIEEPLPEGPFDLVFSALAVHHLQGEQKAKLFGRVAGVLASDGVFVLGDVVVPENPEDAVTPCTPDYDFPSSVAEQIEWLKSAGFSAEVAWSLKDLAVVRAVLGS